MKTKKKRQGGKKAKKQLKVPVIKLNPESPGLVNFLYIFLIGISIIYGALIWGIGRQVEKQTKAISFSTAINLEELKIRSRVNGYPIEAMAPYISKQDKKVAAFILGIAKKESNWGKFSPKKGTKECYNYWGYRGTYNQTYSGYSCFDSPEQAVAVVGERISELIDQQVNSPKKMVVWKCGWDSDCHNEPSAKKWVQDVDLYYNKFYN